MAESTTLASNNPFRRKAATSSSASSALAPPPTPLPPTITPMSAVDPETPATAFDNNALHQTSAAQFRNTIQSLPQSSLPLPQTSFQKPKVVKKVRVQSPPPSSPESAGVPDSYSEWTPQPLGSLHAYGGDNDGDGTDPFGNTIAVGFEDGEESDSDHRPMTSGTTHRNLSQPGLALGRTQFGNEPDEALSQSRKAPAMDVTAFSRLLLTGQRDRITVDSNAHSAAPTGDTGSMTDASSISRNSVFDTTVALGETPRTSHEISDTGDEDHHELTGRSQSRRNTGTLKKKPPPPSSRHGKLIRVELQGTDNHASPGSDRLVPSPLTQSFTPPLDSPSKISPSTPSDINKPLPPAPGRLSVDDGTESIFDREAAGKVPELDVDPDAESVQAPRPPTPPNASHATAAHQATKKPPPPPRRGHGRTDSKLFNVGPSAPTVNVPYPTEEMEPSRSSLDSERTRSRSSSLRANSNAPAPPPPRRPNHTRTNSLLTSPMAPSFNSLTSSGGEKSPAEAERFSYGALNAGVVDALGMSATPSSAEASPGLGFRHSRNSSSASLAQTGHPGLPKLSPPPPPPARNASVRSRKPPSVSSMEATSRRVSKENNGVTSAPHAPPPPPPRQRGSSRGSVDAPGLGPRRTSVDSVRFMRGSVAEEAGETEEPTTAAEPSAVNDILADLDALQREVDAFRAQQRQSGSRSTSGASAG